MHFLNLMSPNVSLDISVNIGAYESHTPERKHFSTLSYYNTYETYL